MSRFIFLLLLVFLARASYGADLNIFVEGSTDMPMAELKDGVLTGGIHRDVGVALAKELGRTPRFSVLPRKRIAYAMEAGEGDLSCQYLPEWISGDFDWTIPFMPNGIFLLSSKRVAEPKSLKELSGVPIGTVLGFAYPEVEAALKDDFVREDAPRATLNLYKFNAGRMHYALVGELFFKYQQKIEKGKMDIHPPLLIRKFLASCIVSKRGQVTVAEVNRAIEGLQRSKKLDAIYKKYQR